ncbi:hypothetical protein IAU60_006839 [Kwoniella sp. DSM 27419]
MSDIELKPIGRSAPPPPPRHPAASSLGDSIPGTLGQAYRSAEEKARAAVHLQEGGLDAISVWGLALAAWLAVLALPLLLFPRILLFFAQTPPAGTSAFSTAGRDDHYDALSPLESTLCLTLSLGLLAVSLISLFILVPSYQPPSSNPSRTPLLGVLVGLTTISGLTLWNGSGIGGLAPVIGGGNVLMAVWGWWVVVFGGGRSGMTKKTKKSKVPDRLKKL